MSELTREEVERYCDEYGAENGTGAIALAAHDTAQREQIKQLEAELAERDAVASWYETLVSRAKIGTAKTPSLRVYIEQLEARIDELENDVGLQEERRQFTARIEQLENIRQDLVAEIEKSHARLDKQDAEIAMLKADASRPK